MLVASSSALALYIEGRDIAPSASKTLKRSRTCESHILFCAVVGYPALLPLTVLILAFYVSAIKLPLL